MRKKPPPRGQPINKRKPPAKPGPKRSLYERLRDHPLEPLRLNLSPQELAEVRKREAELEQARPKSLEEARRELDLLIMPPPRMKSNPKPGSAAAWIDTLFPNGEWRLKKPKQIWRDIRARDREGPSYRAVARELKKRRDVS